MKKEELSTILENLEEKLENIGRYLWNRWEKI